MPFKQETRKTMIALRLNDAEVRHLAELTAAVGGNQSEAVRRLIRRAAAWSAGTAEADEMDEAEVEEGR